VRCNGALHATLRRCEVTAAAQLSRQGGPNAFPKRPYRTNGGAKMENHHMWGEAGLGGLGAETREEEEWRSKLRQLAMYVKEVGIPP
jgi:hypothetical protein